VNFTTNFIVRFIERSSFKISNPIMLNQEILWFHWNAFCYTRRHNQNIFLSEPLKILICSSNSPQVNFVFLFIYLHVSSLSLLIWRNKKTQQEDRNKWSWNCFESILRRWELNDTKTMTGVTSKCCLVVIGLFTLIQLYSFSLSLGHFYQNLFH